MKHWLTLALLASLAVAFSKLLFQDVLGIPWQAIARSLLEDPGAASAAGVVLLLAIDLVLPVPSSLVMILSGALYGTAVGGLLALVGSVVGNAFGFELTRRYGRGAARRLVGEAQLERMRIVFERSGALAIILTRPLPIAMETLSLVAGLARMPRATFLTATLVGTTPVAFAYSYAGALSLEAGTPLPAIVIAVSVIGGAWLIARTRLRPTPMASESVSTERVT